MSHSNVVASTRTAALSLLLCLSMGTGCMVEGGSGFLSGFGFGGDQVVVLATDPSGDNTVVIEVVDIPGAQFELNLVAGFITAAEVDAGLLEVFLAFLFGGELGGTVDVSELVIAVRPSGIFPRQCILLDPAVPSGGTLIVDFGDQLSVTSIDVNTLAVVDDPVLGDLVPPSMQTFTFDQEVPLSAILGGTGIPPQTSSFVAAVPEAFLGGGTATTTLTLVEAEDIPRDDPDAAACLALAETL